MGMGSSGGDSGAFDLRESAIIDVYTLFAAIGKKKIFMVRAKLDVSSALY